MLEPINTVLKAVERLRIQPGDTVLVLGQGPIGLMFTRLFALRGAVVAATDLMPDRLRLARRFGARPVWRGDDPALRARIDRLTLGRGLDAAVVAVPINAAVDQALASVRGGGQILLFAHTRRGDEVPVDLSSICVDEKDLIGSYSADITLQPAVARLVFRRQMDVRPLITHRFPLAETAAAVDLAAHPQAGALKIVVAQT
jgi:L-iditol 2-dehydrogenase